MNPLTKSRVAAINWGSGTLPGGHVSKRKENRCIPLNTNSTGTIFLSLTTTKLASLTPPSRSKLPRRLGSVIS